jgi:TolB-like protein/tRNA A-37 threonylcarbamoyl transferase component Bud32
VFSGKYEVLEVIGRGGMGIVYKVRHRQLDTILALKTLPSYLAGEPDLVRRFHREAKVMAGLHHPNIVRLVDVGHDREPYLVMDYVSGLDLSALLARDSCLGPAALVEAACQVLEALAYAHSRDPSIVHRDVKPSNILIEEGNGRAIVTDFGIAKLVGEAGSDLTIVGLPLGTPRYCAPEQREGRNGVDGRADIYSLGVVLHDMLWSASLVSQAADSRIRGEWEPAGDVKTLRIDGIPGSLGHVVLRATAAAREDRYPSAEAMLSDLRAARAGLSVQPRAADAAGAVLANVNTATERGREAVTSHGIFVPGLGALRSSLARVSGRFARVRRGGERHVDRNTIAVLDFENQRGDAESDWYSRALRSTFSTEIGKLSRFSVVAPDVTGSLPSRDRGDPLRWARRLGVAWLVTGSFAVVHGRIRLDARIVEAWTGYQTASASIQGESSSFHELQERLARDTLRSFALELIKAESDVPPKGVRVDTAGDGSVRR